LLTNLNSMMLKKLCAIGLFILAASPFTAPFQTFYNADPLHGNVNDEIASTTTPTLSCVVLVNDAGSLIAPPGSRLRLDSTSVVDTSFLVTARSVVFRTRSIDSVRRVPLHASPPIALRV
jgi:hypothetical protein